MLIEEWERARLGASDFIEAIPEDQISFRPVPEVLSFGGQFLHIADANLMFAAAAFGTGTPVHTLNSADKPELQNKNATREFALASYDTIVNGLKAIAPAALDDEVPFFKWNMSRRLVLAKALEHHAHHRGQTVVYFRLLGLKPPSERLF